MRRLGEYITYLQDKMADDWVVTAVISVGSLLFVNVCYCWLAVGAVRGLNQRLHGIEQRLVPQYVYAQPVPLANGDPV